MSLTQSSSIGRIIDFVLQPPTVPATEGEIRTSNSSQKHSSRKRIHGRVYRFTRTLMVVDVEVGPMIPVFLGPVKTVEELNYTE
jgi:hypothetical protein